MKIFKIGLAGFGGMLVGAAIAYTFAGFATLYEPECPSFNLDAVNPHCRDPLYFIYGGLSLAVLGAVTTLGAVVAGCRRWLQRRLELGSSGRRS